MSTAERMALSQGLAFYDEMSSVIDDKTLEILDQRRRTAVVRRRGWLVRQLLLLADLTVTASRSAMSATTSTPLPGLTSTPRSS